jgi:hypothetical protein
VARIEAPRFEPSTLLLAAGVFSMRERSIGE